MKDFLWRWCRRRRQPPVAVPTAAEVLLRVQELLAGHREQELRQPWPDMPAALAELAVIEGMAMRLAAETTDGSVFLRALEAALAVRLENYTSHAEYSSDKGRLGSVLLDVSALREAIGAG